MKDYSKRFPLPKSNFWHELPDRVVVLENEVKDLSETPSSIATNGASLYSTNPLAGPTGTYYNIAFGLDAGKNTTEAVNCNFLGLAAGYNSNDSYNSNFIGTNTGVSAVRVYNSNFIGTQAGYQASLADNSNFLGYQSGMFATGAFLSNFIGYKAGHSANYAFSSNFLGDSAGYNATEANSSNFLGENSGYNATNSRNCNFLGSSAGYQATDADHSNFLGQFAGHLSTNGRHSNFLGFNAGREANNASFSNLLGYSVGKSFTGNNIGSNNIIIGTNISLPNATTNKVNIGGILFGSGTYSTITGNPLVTPATSGKIGIGIVEPTANLHIKASTTASALMKLEVGPAPTTPNDGDIWLESNTNTGLKIRINGTTKTITLS